MSYDNPCNANLRRVKVKQAGKVEWRRVNIKINPKMYQELYRAAGQARDTLTDWVTEAIMQRLDRERR